MRETFRSICRQWNILYDDTEGDLEVGACGTSRRFIRIGPTVSVSAFLTYADYESNDLLLKVSPGFEPHIHQVPFTPPLCPGRGYVAEAAELVPGGVHRPYWCAPRGLFGERVRGDGHARPHCRFQDCRGHVLAHGRGDAGDGARRAVFD